MAISSLQRAGESLIADQLAANHHALAQQLQQVLGKQRLKQIPENGLRLLPRYRHSGEDLVILEVVCGIERGGSNKELNA